MKRLYGICITDPETGVGIRHFKVLLTPERARRTFEKYARNGRGVIACLEGDPIEIPYTIYNSGPEPGVYDQVYEGVETLPREKLWELFPQYPTWTSRIIARSNELSGVGI